MSQSEVPEDKIQQFQKLRSWHFQTYKQQLVAATEGVGYEGNREGGGGGPGTRGQTNFAATDVPATKRS